jgi:hypothetical protein
MAPGELVGDYTGQAEPMLPEVTKLFTHKVPSSDSCGSTSDARIMLDLKE